MIEEQDDQVVNAENYTGDVIVSGGEIEASDKPKSNPISEDFILKMKDLFGDKDPFPKLIREREACVALSEKAYFIEEFSPFLLSLLLFVSDEPEITGHLASFIDYLPEALTAQAQEGTTSIKVNRLLAFYSSQIYSDLLYHRMFLEYALRAIHSRLPTYINRLESYSDPYDYSTQWDLLSKVFGVKVIESLREEAFHKKVVKINPSNRIHIDEGQYQQRKEYNLELILEQKEEESTLYLKKVPHKKIEHSSQRGLTRDYAAIIDQHMADITRIIEHYDTQPQKTKQELVTCISALLLRRVCSDFEREVESKDAYGAVLTQYYLEADKQQVSKAHFAAGTLCKSQTDDEGVTYFIDSRKQIVRYPTKIQALTQSYEGLLAIELASGQCSRDNYFLIKNRLEVVEVVFNSALSIFMAPKKTVDKKVHQWSEQYNIFSGVKNADTKEEASETESPLSDIDDESLASLVDDIAGEL